VTIEHLPPEERRAARQQWSFDLAGRVLLVTASRRASLTMPVVRIRWIRRQPDPGPVESEQRMTEQQELRGGVNVVRRYGDVVHRPASPAAPAVHRLLRHLHDHGFHGAPEPCGFDSEGNEILTFLDGEVPDVLTPELRTTEFLATAAALLRGLHDASVTFRPRPDDPWLFPVHRRGMTGLLPVSGTDRR